MNLLLVDDHVLFREGLKLILSQLDLCAATYEAGTLLEAIEIADRNSDIDLALLDLGLPGIHGMEALSEFRRRFETVPVVVLSGLADRHTVVEALERGAAGFIAKSMSPELLRRAVQVALGGGICLPPMPDVGAAQSLATVAAPVEPWPRRLCELGLTARQVEVVRLIVQGKPNKLIARELGVAESTVKAHVRPILKALNVTSRVGAILQLGRFGMTLE